MIKAFVNPLVAWVWIGWLVMVVGTGVALVPNAQAVKAPVAASVAVAAMEKQGMAPAGAGR
jgi:cytochrome c-type biogenesis protein CcmF